MLHVPMYCTPRSNYRDYLMEELMYQEEMKRQRIEEYQRERARALHARALYEARVRYEEQLQKEMYERQLRKKAYERQLRWEAEQRYLVEMERKKRMAQRQRSLNAWASQRCCKPKFSRNASPFEMDVDGPNVSYFFIDRAPESCSQNKTPDHNDQVPEQANSQDQGQQRKETQSEQGSTRNEEDQLVETLAFEHFSSEDESDDASEPASSSHKFSASMAAAIIQNAYRRFKTLKSIKELESDYDKLMVSGVFDQALSTELVMKGLTYEPHRNKSFASIEEKLTRLLLALDAIEVHGDALLKARRRAMVKAVQNALNKLDEKRDAASNPSMSGTESSSDEDSVDHDSITEISESDKTPASTSSEESATISQSRPDDDDHDVAFFDNHMLIDVADYDLNTDPVYPDSQMEDPSSPQTNHDSDVSESNELDKTPSSISQGLSTKKLPSQSEIDQSPPQAEEQSPLEDFEMVSSPSKKVTRNVSPDQAGFNKLNVDAQKLPNLELGDGGHSDDEKDGSLSSSASSVSETVSDILPDLNQMLYASISAPTEKQAQSSSNRKSIRKSKRDSFRKRRRSGTRHRKLKSAHTSPTILDWALLDS